jgi:hypothetical protein
MPGQFARDAQRLDKPSCRAGLKQIAGKVARASTLGWWFLMNLGNRKSKQEAYFLFWIGRPPILAPNNNWGVYS